MGSSCAVADVQGDKATIWSPTQGVWYQKSTAAMVLGLKPENVHVIFKRGAGCYGLNAADTVTYDAALLSQAVGKPVRVQLTRKDEMTSENYGNPFLMDERAGLDAQGNIVAWDHEAWSPAHGNRPGPGTPGNVITGSLVGFEPQRFSPGAAAEPKGFNNNSNGIPSYAAALFDGVPKGAGTVRSARVLVHNLPSPFFTGPLRSPARFQNTFAHECFMDELAAHVKADPVEYRLRHLRSDRVIGVAESRGESGQLGHAPFAKARQSQDGRRHRPRRCVCGLRGRQRIHRHRHGNRSRPGYGQNRGEARRGRHRRRPHLKPGRPHESSRRRSAARHEPRAHGRGHLGSREGHVSRLADLSHLAARLRASQSGVRAGEPAGRRSHRRRRNVHHRDRGRHR